MCKEAGLWGTMNKEGGLHKIPWTRTQDSYKLPWKGSNVLFFLWNLILLEFGACPWAFVFTEYKREKINSTMTSLQWKLNDINCIRGLLSQKRRTSMIESDYKVNKTSPIRQKPFVEKLREGLNYWAKCWLKMAEISMTYI